MVEEKTYPSFTQNSLVVLERRYRARNKEGETIESPDGVFRRTADNIAQAEWYYLDSSLSSVERETFVKATADRFYDMMRGLDCVPNSPTLMNAGRRLQMLSACFVLPIEDDMDSIFTGIRNTAMVHKSGGGCAKAGTPVATFRGLVPIEDVRVGDYVYAFDPVSYDTRPAKVLQIHKYVVEDAYNIVLNGGREITTSAWHPFMVFNGEEVIEKRADELGSEDYIMSPAWFVPMQPEDDVDLHWLMGFYVGDGLYTTGTRGKPVIKFCVATPEEERAVNDSLYKVFGKRYSVDRSGTVPVIALQGLEQTSLFAEYFTPGPKSKTVELPLRFHTPAAVAGLFDADSSAGKVNKQVRVQLETSSEDLARVVAGILNLWGINTYVRYHTSGVKSRFGSTSGWRIQINEVESLSRFVEFVGPYLKRLEVPEITSEWSNRSSNLSPRVSHLNDGATRTYKWEKGGSSLSTTVASRLVLDERLKTAIEYSHKVVSVSRVEGGRDFRDLTVEGYQTYAAGEFGLMFIHNTGFSFSKLRPKGDIVGSTGGIASGPISFLRVYDSATEEVKQGGTRRGANMAVLNIDHPDILMFIHCKENGKSISNFNISVAVTEEWMKKVEKGENYDLISPRDGSVVGTLNARKVFYEHICPMAWKTGDPGLWFIDRVNLTHPNPHLGKIESCNPCGEQELLPYESCNLASVNLSNHIDISRGQFDWDKLKKTISTAVRFLDNVIDMNKYPIPQIEEMSKHTRRIGLGLMGWADALIKLRIRYDSNEALDLARRVMEFIQHVTHKSSQHLAEERGCYPAWEGSRYSHKGIMMRNTAPVTIAPTGTISIIAGVSSGVEPLFALSYVRNVMDKDRLVEAYQPLKEEAQARGFYLDQMFEELADKGSLSELSNRFKDSIPADVYEVYRTSYDVAPEWHVKMQAAFQEFTDNAVSKTINLPESATVDIVAGAYMLAYKTNCKGITVYRDGSKDEQVLSFGKKGQSPESIGNGKHSAEMHALMSTIPERPREIDGKTIKMSTGHGNTYITLNHIGGKLVEAFTNVGKAGGCQAAQMEAITRLISLALRRGIPPQQVIDQLKGITCCPIYDGGVQVRSGPDAIAIAMEQFLGLQVTDVPFQGAPTCPDCFSQVIYQEGCTRCTNTSCGWSKCD